MNKVHRLGILLPPKRCPCLSRSCCALKSAVFVFSMFLRKALMMTAALYEVCVCMWVCGHDRVRVTGCLYIVLRAWACFSSVSVFSGLPVSHRVVMWKIIPRQIRSFKNRNDTDATHTCAVSSHKHHNGCLLLSLFSITGLIHPEIKETRLAS